MQEIENMLTLPLLPLRGLVAFPEMFIHFDVGRDRSLQALTNAMKADQRIFLTTQKELSLDDPGAGELYAMGTICVVKQMLKLPGGSVRVMVEGIERARILDLIAEESCLFARVEPCESILGRTSEKKLQALLRAMKDCFEQYAEHVPRISTDIALRIKDEGDPGYLADYLAQNISLSYSLKQEILEEVNSVRRLEKMIRILKKETEVLKLEIDIQDKLRHQIDKSQKEYYLREQLKVIQTELGDREDPVDEAEEYHEKILALGLPTEAEEKLLKEANRLMRMQSTSAESAVVRTYLDTCLDMPWNKETSDRLNLDQAKNVLDKDHFGLDKVKERILEALAVKKLAPKVKGQVLCLVGPPGVGKTSVAASVAKAMRRKYARVSLGGMRDEADIRGHRKTYIGAMPGRVIQALRQAGSKNPVIVLDEIDKLGSDFRGDPASALLEVLDTEQNFAFRDHYIELPFDLSEVFFITTANDISRIPRPLLDRMEVIEISGYIDEEKKEIAKRHLIPKQIQKYGLKAAQISIQEEAVLAMIAGYTREAGVRKLEQTIAKICRQVAKKIASEEAKRVIVRANDLEAFLGIPRYKNELVSQSDQIGVVNGLAWTSAGGEILQVEVGAVPGTGKTEITGNLGQIMQESAKAAITYVRSRSEELDINEAFYRTMDLHIHFPEGAIPKDGPSAGITMATAIVSALSGAPCRANIAMTGEVTLRGRVLPIGGLKEKTMAAFRAGVSTVILPKRNESDLQEIDPRVRENLNFILVDDMDEVVGAALDFSARIKPYIPSHAPNQPLLTQ